MIRRDAGKFEMVARQGPGAWPHHHGARQEGKGLSCDHGSLSIADCIAPLLSTNESIVNASTFQQISKKMP
jgi:hypothetical protein